MKIIVNPADVPLIFINVFHSEVVHFQMERDAAITLSRVVDMDVGNHLCPGCGSENDSERRILFGKTCHCLRGNYGNIMIWKMEEHILTYSMASVCHV